MKLPRGLRHAKKVVIDTNVLIYLFEDHSRYGTISEFILDEVASGAFSAVITSITVAELLTKPLESDRTDIADAYRNVLKNLPNVETVECGFDVGVMAAALRAKYGVPLPDAFQAAVAMQAPRPSLITNDRRLRKISEVRSISLNEFN